jgi:peptidoglycan/LPS O-acetylase OafA/YrhL
MRYRTDIDGLRAIAIIPVVLFHYGLKHPFSGGFVGVDVFFVISGFLITWHIDDEILNGSFSIADFYNRRIRRIFPALFAVLLFCFVCSLIVEIPPEVENTRNGILGATFFVSNVVFYHMSGYFDTLSQDNPLLHTWSLSVEEQFYIIVPLALFLVQKFAERAKVFVLFGVLFASFLFCSFEVYHNPSAAFYLVQNRAWELLVGAAVAIGGIPIVKSPRLLEALGVAGIVLILGSVFIINTKSAFPGPGALAPCLGAALILYAGGIQSTAVASALSVRPLRFVGLVSYSLYLWHWPIWVFFCTYYKPDFLSTVLLIALAFGVSVLSWRFIETPFRAQPFRLSAIGTVGVAGAVMAGMALLAVIAVPLSSSMAHYSPAVKNIMAYMDYKPAEMRDGTCFLDLHDEDLPSFKASHCLDVNPAEPNYLILGDSHAADLWYGLAHVNPGVNFLQATVPSCEPIMGKGGGKCGALMRYMFDEFIPAHHLDGIILSANWLGGDLKDAIATAQKLKPYAGQVVIFGPSPEYDQPLPLLLARGLMKHDMSFVFDHLLRDRQARDKAFAALAAKAGVEYVSIYQLLCAGGECVTTVHGDTPILFDADHFTPTGSELLATKIKLFPGDPK